LHASGAPLILESALVPYFVLLAAVFFGITLPVICFFLALGVWLMLNRKTIERKFPQLYLTHLTEAEHFKQYFKAYAKYHLPFILMVLAVSFGQLFTNSWWWWTLLALVGYAAGSRYRFKDRKEVFLDLGGWFWDFYVSLSWLMLVLIVASIFLAKTVESTNTVVIVLCAIGSILLHWFVSRLSNISTAVAFIVLLLFGLIVVFPGASFLAGGTLSFLGIGGNIPISLLVKTYEPGSTQATANVVHGCLVLSLGNDVLIRQANLPSECKLRLSNSALAEEKPYHRLNRFARSEVLKIWEFADDCGTVDGLPTCNENMR
jgi:hypothetical protein